MVTVVITTFNRAEMLREAITSVLQQTYEGFQVVVCDNASTDYTEAVVRSFMQQDMRVKHCRRPYNLGGAKNWHHGFTDAHTDYVAWLMDDDLWYKDHLADGVTRLEQYPGAVLYACGTIRASECGNTVVHPWFLKEGDGDVVLEPTRDYISLLPHCPFVGSSVIFRRKALDAIPFWPPEISVGDWILWGLLALQGRVIYNPSVRALYHWHKGNDTNKSLTGRRCAAQNAEARRILANTALNAGILNYQDIVSFFTSEAEAAAVCRVALSLCCSGMPHEVRRAAIKALVQRPVLTAGSGKHILLRMARFGGGFAFPWFDRANQILGRWRPSGVWPVAK